MKRMKIAVLFMFVVFLGANVANLHLMSALMPTSTSSRFSHGRGEVPAAQPSAQRAVPALDYHTLLEISEYLSAEASFNGFKITTIVYSAALLIESEDMLIIVGHGHFNSKRDYFIGYYSGEWIKKLSSEKESIALLACYSATIDLADKMILSYAGKIDLKLAVNDLIDKLDWMRNLSFLPSKNFMLVYDLDPGFINGLNPLYSNGVKYAYTHYDMGYYWDLNTDAGYLGVGNWMIAHRGILVKISLTNYYYEQLSENIYQLISGTITYDAWVIRKSDMNDYLHIEKIINEGVKSKKKYDVRIKSIKAVIENDVFWAGVAVSCALALTTILLEIGILLLKNRITYKPILITVTALGESVLGIPAGPYILTVPTINTCVAIIGVTLVIIAVLIIASGLVYAIYNLCN